LLRAQLERFTDHINRGLKHTAKAPHRLGRPIMFRIYFTREVLLPPSLILVFLSLLHIWQYFRHQLAPSDFNRWLQRQLDRRGALLGSSIAAGARYLNRLYTAFGPSYIDADYHQSLFRDGKPIRWRCAECHNFGDSLQKSCTRCGRNNHSVILCRHCNILVPINSVRCPRCLALNDAAYACKDCDAATPVCAGQCLDPACRLENPTLHTCWACSADTPREMAVCLHCGRQNGAVARVLDPRLLGAGGPIPWICPACSCVAQSSLRWCPACHAANPTVQSCGNCASVFPVCAAACGVCFTDNPATRTCGDCQATYPAHETACKCGAANPDVAGCEHCVYPLHRCLGKCLHCKKTNAPLLPKLPATEIFCPACNIAFGAALPDCTNCGEKNRTLHRCDGCDFDVARSLPLCPICGTQNPTMEWGPKEPAPQDDSPAREPTRPAEGAAAAEEAPPPSADEPSDDAEPAEAQATAPEEPNVDAASSDASNGASPEPAEPLTPKQGSLILWTQLEEGPQTPQTAAADIAGEATGETVSEEMD
ncbi:hypothetical protein FN846DRAFT_991057, partial [Sphaerosporella brunnea]